MEKKVAGGLYQTASEVIRAGLRHLKEDQDVRLPQAAKTLETLEARLLQAVDRLERGKGVDGETVFRRLRKRMMNVIAHRSSSKCASSRRNQRLLTWSLAFRNSTRCSRGIRTFRRMRRIRESSNQLDPPPQSR